MLKTKNVKRSAILLTFVLLIFLCCYSVNVVFAETLIDEYPSTNRDNNCLLNRVFPTNYPYVSACGQTFEGKEYNVTRAVFNLFRYGSPTGFLRVAIYNIDGTHGTDGKPDGLTNWIALSDAKAMSSVGGSYADHNFTFSGDNRTGLEASTYYAIAILAFNETIDSSNYIRVGIDANLPTHAGNWFYYAGSGNIWQPQSTKDCCFELYGEELGPPEPNNVTVSLNTPVNNTSVDRFNQLFNYTPVLVGSDVFHNATLYLNGSAQTTNSSALVNNTINTLGYNFTSNAVYLWNVGVYNSTDLVFAPENYTLIVDVLDPLDLGEFVLVLVILLFVLLLGVIICTIYLGKKR